MPGLVKRKVLDAPPSAPRIRWVVRLLGWNALLLLVGAVLAAMAGEAYLRLTRPFIVSNEPWEFVPNVGRLRPPNTEIRHTNGRDFWNVSRTNGLGFLDREPPSPERAAATCHISMIGDSFVEAKEVPIHDKLHVRLEELAADELPHLNITTSAFGLGATGQVQQLPFYDEYARLLHPKLLVLVFVPNDLLDNVPFLRPLMIGEEFRKNLEPTVGRRSDGKLELAWSRPRDQLPFPSSPRIRASWAARAKEGAVNHSWFALWLRRKGVLFLRNRESFRRDVEALRRQPGYAALVDEVWRPTITVGQQLLYAFARRDLPPVLEDALQYTRFALEQFQQRADRDGAKLVILASYRLKTSRKIPMFERLSEMAATLDIPVIDQADFILRQGARLGDARWPHDYHWNPAGHRWAAEALLEYLEKHPAICDRPTGAVTPLEPTP